MLIKDPPVEITPAVSMLGTTEYPLYLVRGESRAAIFEGGTGAMGHVVARQLESAGVDPESVRQVVITHAHPDHVMAVPLLRERFGGIEVVAPEIAARTLSLEKAISFFRKVDSALTESLAAAGRIEPGGSPPPLEENRIAVDRTVREGDTVEVDEGISFGVLETPGHSDCSTSFYDREHSVLLISDATGYYMPQEGTWWPNYFSDYAAYLSSMERLAGLGAEVLCLSHNGAIRGADDVRAYFEGAIEATRRYHERIVDAARAGRSPREIGERLGSEIHEKANVLPLDFFQKNCALLAKQSLRHEGLGNEER